MKLEEHLKGQEVEEELAKLMILISEQGKKIKDSFIGRQTYADSKNIYGEQQVALDKWADELLLAELSKSGLVRAIASEEQPDVVPVPESSGKYSVTMDPLDGSSLIGVNLAVGTIIGIFHSDSPLHRGTDMVAAMYILYGPLTTLTYTVRKGVHEFVLNDTNEFVLQKENITIPEGKIYAPGALRKDYLPEHKSYIEELEADGYKLRYSGSFVADVHQILHKGGVFTYPGFLGREQGKLRLLFECNPMGMIVTEAGGAVSTGRENILDIQPTGVDIRVPIYVGGKNEIQLIEGYMSKEGGL
jgi:fructose-1,6-bisphosphatase I